MPNQPPRFPGLPGFPSLPKLPSLDAVIGELDKALKTLAATPVAQRPNPAGQTWPVEQLSDSDKEQVIGLMRVNHVGEICAQALYQAQALASKDPEKRLCLITLPKRKPTTWHGPKSAWTSWVRVPVC